MGRVWESVSTRDALKKVSRGGEKGREATSPGELDYLQTNGDRLDVTSLHVFGIISCLTKMTSWDKCLHRKCLTD